MSQINALIITIGDEILYGQTLDTNSHWISQELDTLGITLVRKITIPDTKKDILESLHEAENRADLIILTGGLGPTDDDLTKASLADYFNVPLVMFDDALEDIKRLFQHRGRDLNQHNIKQAELPQNCEMISNKVGTAPGMWFEKNDQVFISMPGVPREMKKMMLDIVIPKLRKKFKTDIRVHKIIKTCTIGESVLIDKIDEWVKKLPKDIQIAYYPSVGQVKIRLTAVGDNRNELKQMLNQHAKSLTNYISKYIFGYDNDLLEAVLGNQLKEKSLKIATAESCTGGTIASKITSVAGSSAYYQGSVVPYHNDLKSKILKVDQDVFTKVGAVSEECVIQMAEHALELFDADISIATSGIAGPSGGTAEKPVGTVWIAVAYGDRTVTKLLKLGNDRNFNIELTAVHALNLARLALLEIV